MRKARVSASLLALDGSVGPTRGGASIEGLQRMGSNLVEDELGTIAPDGRTHVQRHIVDAVPDREGVSLEQEVSYRLLAPLVWWLQRFPDENRRAGFPDPEINRRAWSRARSPGGGKRRTHVF